MKKHLKPSVADIKLHQDDRISIYIPISKEDDRINRLILINRQSSEEINLPLQEKDVNDELRLLYGHLDYKHWERKLLNGKFWDLYLQNGDGNHRLRTTKRSIEYVRIKEEESGITFHPYLTKKGNVSFRYSEIDFFAGINQVKVAEDSRLLIEGLLEKVDLENVTDANLLVNDAFNVESRFPVQINRQEEAGFYSFTSEIELGETVTEELPNYLKVSIELETFDGNQTMWRLSPRLKYYGNEPLDESFVTNVNNLDIKFKISTSKIMNYLTIHFLEDNLIKEYAHKVEKNIVKARRGKRALKFYKNVFQFVSYLPRKRNLVVFESFHGKQYSDSPRAIYEYMDENYPSYNLIWSADRRHYDEFLERGLPVVRRFSFKWLLVMTRAKYWVTNTRLPNWLPKPKQTEYVQTWHGTPLKRLAADMEEVHMPGTNTLKYKSNFIKEANKWDYLVAPNEYSSNIFRSAFLFSKNMIESGYPRNDYLYQENNQDTIDQIKESLNLPLDKKVVLYAPTWRDNQFYQRGKYKFDLSLDLQKMREELGEDYVVVLRMHYLIAENFDLGPFEGFVYDFSKHEDIRDLYLISDLLITDYSSVFFDYANLRRPIIFYVYDIDEYRDSLRGFYLDLEKEAPGPLAKTTDEVIDSIKEFERNDYELGESFEAFYDRFCSWEEGESSKRVVETVFK
ncbi:CDP-glycerol:poly(glycerophosphate) glycerophosphotransferase [Halobacillus andaensis]|uniref:CDP-glycerol:poly(Glycerophosphate) glycerophosphotransferase n=1 Tax=Halobacillus andaensis TaxID=1176239 RepID=A0A917F0N5_HALAA|nr:CDP-glycerol glycerophosphotransferase family protein [Halobacillus andaensis]MBP2005385.1 CDP-glycerol glycerophosphotransferase [Halobacillus andaensis]GGF31081.1 CDP-glycerol:poly(glycerophosphate) glycerophosphotransferase [Halobacillus andaensis]